MDEKVVYKNKIPSQYEVLSTVCTNLDMIFKYYSGKPMVLRDKLRDEDVKKYIENSIVRMLSDNFDYAIDPEKDAEVDFIYRIYKGEFAFHNLYIAIVENFSKVIVDKTCAYIPKDDASGIYPVTIVILPQQVFFSDQYHSSDDTNRLNSASILVDLYCSLVDEFDKEMQFNCGMPIIKNCNNMDAGLTLYDISMACAAFGMACVNIRSWSGANLDSGTVLANYSEEDLPDDICNKFKAALDKYAISVGALRDAIGDGSFVSEILE